MVEANPSYMEIRDEIHVHTRLLIRLNRQYIEGEDLGRIKGLLEDMNVIKWNVKDLHILFKPSMNNLEDSHFFDIPSEVGLSYQVDDLLTYKK